MPEKSPAPREGLSGKAMKRITMGSFADVLMEWYDFSIFDTAVGLIFSPLLCSGSDSPTGLAVSFATLGVGFLTRPLGGVVFGHFGDKIERKITPIWTLAIVGYSTFPIGFISTYQKIGIWASLALMMLRLIQGLGLGSEYGGVALMAIRSTLGSRRGSLGSLPQMTMSVGIMPAADTFALCDHFPALEQLLPQGWRVPSWLPAVMLIARPFIRLHTEEMLDSQEQKATDSKEKSVPPLIELLKRHPRNILLALGVRLAESVSFDITNAFGIVYISSQLASSRDISLTSMLIASAIDIFGCPLVGWLSDRIGQKSLYLPGARFCALSAFPLFLLLDNKSMLTTWCGMTLGHNLDPMMISAVQLALSARMFGAKVRYTGPSFAHQFSAILGGLNPLIASSLLTLGGGKPWYAALFLFAVSVLPLVCVWPIESTDEQGTASYRYIREQSHEN